MNRNDGKFSRRDWLKSTCTAGMALATAAVTPDILSADDQADVLDIGSRRQLFVGQDLIGSMDGVRQVLHHPVRRDIAIKPEHPWENLPSSR